MISRTGGQYNLLSFNPRGVGDTLPFSCSQTEEEFQHPQNVSYKVFANSSDAELRSTWTLAQDFAGRCHATLGDSYGNLVGTAFVARDMMEIVDALKDDGLLRY